MSELTLHGGRVGTAYDAAWWQAVHGLFDEAFPGLPEGIARARAVGAEWNQMSTPFALFDGDRCVAHVGLLSHPVRVLGQTEVFAGLHAVCTATDHRRRGLSRRLQREALAFADRSHRLAKLSTDDPPVYTGEGFEVVPTFRFRPTVSPVDPGPTRALRCASEPADLALLKRLCAERTWTSDRFASVEPGWLVLIDAALSNLLDRCWVFLEDWDCVVALHHNDARVLVMDVIGPQLPPAAVVLGAVTADKPVLWQFTPDRLDPDAEPVPVVHEESGSLMVRGSLPEELGPFGVSALWEH